MSAGSTFPFPSAQGPPRSQENPALLAADLVRRSRWRRAVLRTGAAFGNVEYAASGHVVGTPAGHRSARRLSECRHARLDLGRTRLPGADCERLRPASALAPGPPKHSRPSEVVWGRNGSVQP